MTTKREYENRARMMDRLALLGFTRDDSEALRRIAMTLHRWNERECNGEIDRDEVTGKTYYVSADHTGAHRRYRTPDRETGAQRRLLAIMARYPDRGAYLQGDPRGAPLYIFRHVDLDTRGGGQAIDSCYSSIGVAVY